MLWCLGYHERCRRRRRRRPRRRRCVLFVFLDFQDLIHIPPKEKVSQFVQLSFGDPLEDQPDSPREI